MVAALCDTKLGETGELTVPLLLLVVECFECFCWPWFLSALSNNAAGLGGVRLRASGSCGCAGVRICVSGRWVKWVP